MKTRLLKSATALLLALIMIFSLIACVGETPDLGGNGDIGDVGGNGGNGGTGDIGGNGGNGGTGGNGGNGGTGDVGGNGGTSECTSHTDTNDDGECDRCEISVVFVFDIFALNDLHGKFDDTDSCVGVDELSSYLVNQTKENAATVILSSGDMWQGSAESNLTKGAIITDWMNEMNFASLTLGNHEFDWGTEYISENARIADFAVLAINVYDKTTGKRADFCESSVIVERNGVKVGIIGAIGNCKSSISSSLVENYDFKVGGELSSLVKAESEKLRAAGCELIIYSLHDGHGSSSSTVQYPTSSEMRSYYDTSLSNGYVDLVFEGHSHRSYVHIDDYGVYHLQNGGYDNGISHVEIKVNIANDKTAVNVAEIVENYEYEAFDDHPIVDELLLKYNEYIAVALEELGYNSSNRDSSFICQLAADLYIEKGLERWGEEYDIVLGGGYLSARDPYILPMGTLKYYDLMSVLPFDNEIFLCEISGYNLKKRFINTSNGNYYISLSDYGNSILNNIDNNSTYYVIADKYSVDYAPNGLVAVESYGKGIYARDLIADYVRGGGLNTEYERLSIEEALLIAADISHGYKTVDMYLLEGRITEIVQPEYGNLYLTDENGNTIYVYGIYDENGNRYDSMQNPPKVGDYIRILCYLSNYNGPQLKEAIVIEIV